MRQIADLVVWVVLRMIVVVVLVVVVLAAFNCQGDPQKIVEFTWTVFSNIVHGFISLI